MQKIEQLNRHRTQELRKMLASDKATDNSILVLHPDTLLIHPVFLPPGVSTRDQKELIEKYVAPQLHLDADSIKTVRHSGTYGYRLEMKGEGGARGSGQARKAIERELAAVAAEMFALQSVEAKRDEALLRSIADISRLREEYTHVAMERYSTIGVLIRVLLAYDTETRPLSVGIFHEVQYNTHPVSTSLILDGARVPPYCKNGNCFGILIDPLRVRVHVATKEDAYTPMHSEGRPLHYVPSKRKYKMDSGITDYSRVEALENKYGAKFPEHSVLGLTHKAQRSIPREHNEVVVSAQTAKQPFGDAVIGIVLVKHDRVTHELLKAVRAEADVYTPQLPLFVYSERTGLMPVDA
jgi:hypothetical protein